MSLFISEFVCTLEANRNNNFKSNANFVELSLISARHVFMEASRDNSNLTDVHFMLLDKQFPQLIPIVPAIDFIVYLITRPEIA